MARILIIEDDVQVRMAIQHCLKKSGHTVHAASDGRAGMNHLRDHPVDLVVTDVFMEG